MDNLMKVYFKNGIKEYIYKKITKHPDYIFYKAVLVNQRYRKYKDNNNTFLKFLYSFKANHYASKYNLELYGKYGKNLRIWHGNIIINGQAKIGDNVNFHGNNCIGETKNGTPVIGNNVEIGYGATIIGNIKIADNITIGANSLVNKSFAEEGVIIAGNPAHIISKKGGNDE